MKDYCKIELVLKEQLEKDDPNTLFARYQQARKYLFENIYPKIGESLPNFTYHDGSHAIDVLENISQLLDDNIDKITGETLYFLCLSALFHDVGLIYGRDDHQKKINDIYNDACGKESIQKIGNEKIIISKAVEAHSGKSMNNTNDTLEYLGELPGYSEPINVMEIAAILRFADELAEGGQRTSDYFLARNKYPKNSKIFHRYSQSYKSIISNKNNRLVITYNIGLLLSNTNELLIDPDIKLKTFLDFIYQRIIKLDDERKYCRYYCQWLDRMKEISIDFNFWYESERVEIGLPPLILSDKIIPGESGRKIEKLYSYSNIDNILHENLKTFSKENVL